MKKKYLYILVSLILIMFSIISIISIYSATNNSSIVAKQILWFLVGFFIIIFYKKININKIINSSFYLYIIGIIMLFLLLIIGVEINGSKCWFIIPKIGSFQPSEFIKIILILINIKFFQICKVKNTLGSNIKLFFIIIFLTLIPAILTFMQPDTGIVIIYFLISISMLYIYGIKKSIFITLLFFIIIAMSSFIYIYLFQKNLFISIFGTSFFYRMDRLLDWTNKSGMQLTNALASIKAAGMFGFGINKTPIYIPEAHTDFIFSTYSSNTGYFGSIILILLTIIFDITLLVTAYNSKNKECKYFCTGFTIMLIFQQIQNIGMNIGILPITGITLPFISYGGSSLLSYMISIAIIFKLYDKEKKQIT